MTNEISKRVSFKVNVSPHLDPLLQISKRLTRNGGEATRLLRETIAEAYRSWERPLSPTSCRIWLHKLLTRRFLTRFQQHLHQFDTICDPRISENRFGDNRLAPVTTTGARPDSSPADEFDENVIYFKAIAGLPAAVRPAMILSCLEGFSSGEIANLAGVQSYAVESLLKRGRALLQNELFGHLLGNEGHDAVADREQCR
ncbi:MAG: RNA polymerase sigma factor [bacterium]